jgi:hypothetical protein
MKYGLPEAFHLLQNPPKKNGMENYGRQESIAAFSTSIGFGLTVFHTGWHCPILHVFTDMRFNELLEFLSSTRKSIQN